MKLRQILSLAYLTLALGACREKAASRSAFATAQLQLAQVAPDSVAFTVTTDRGGQLARFKVAIPIDTFVTVPLPAIHDTVKVNPDGSPWFPPPPAPVPPPPAPVPPPPAPVPPPPAPVPPPPAPLPPGPPIPPVPGSFPLGFDPARLGASRLAGESWQNIVQGSDNGWTSMKALMGGWALGSSPTGASSAVVGVYPDPLFLKAVRITNPAGSPATAQAHFSFAPSNTVWVRWTIKLTSSDTGGFTSKTLTPGESGTYKLAFLWPVNHANGRQSFVLAKSGELMIESPITSGTVTNLAKTDATTPPPQPYGAFKGFYAGDVPLMGGPYPTGSMLKTGDWYALYLNVSEIDATNFLRRWFVQRLTVGGKWAPWTYPTWKGFKVSGAAPVAHNEFWITGNKSGAAITLQWMWLGPFEISSAKDPYGWDHYGR